MGADLATRRRRTDPAAELIKENVDVSAAEVDRYLSALEEPKRSTLQQLREAILRAVPDAEECISYGLPAFRVNGKVVAGFAAFKNHLSYLPHSGSVLDQLSDQLTGYTMTAGSLRFPVGEPLRDRLVERLIAVRLHQLRASSTEDREPSRRAAKTNAGEHRRDSSE